MKTIIGCDNDEVELLVVVKEVDDLVDEDELVEWRDWDVLDEYGKVLLWFVLVFALNRTVSKAPTDATMTATTKMIAVNVVEIALSFVIRNENF